MRSARAFLTGLIDYAGLFPPASLGMADAMRSYAAHAAGPDRDLLGRFVVPASRLDELTESARDLLAHGESSDPWRLSVTVGTELEPARDAVLHFNRSHWKASELGHALCDAIETPAADAGAVETAFETFPDFFQLFLEVPIARDPEPIIAAMALTRAAAKVRTGGVTADAIPPTTDVLRFMRACSRHRVPFKATAGLHHAVRAEYPLTYESGSPKGEMLGYLNIFLAAAFLDSGSTDEDVLMILEERDAASFRFDQVGVSWRGHALKSEQLDRTRRGFALSFGSCSFSEPVSEAKELGLI